MQKRELWVRALVVVLSVSLTVFLAVAALLIHLFWSIRNHEDVHSRLRFVYQFKLLTHVLADPAYLALKTYQRAETANWVAEQGERGRLAGARFRAVWDFDRGVGLSRRMFNSVEMFGQPKFVYRPRTHIINARVWTGFRYRKFVTAGSSQLMEKLEKCHVASLTEFETTGLGLKPTTFHQTTSQESVLFLGDSFTEGLFTPPGQTFVNEFGLIAKRDGRHLVPLNLGVNGYSTLEMAWVLKDILTKLVSQPRLLIVNLFPNDVNFDTNAVVRGEAGSDEAYEEMFGYLTEISRFAADHSIEILISVIPAKSQFEHLLESRAFQVRVRAWCSKTGTFCVDPHHYLNTRGGVANYLAWDPHFSRQGHRNYAQFLYEQAHP